MKIAIAQLNPTVGDLEGNANQILEAAKIAAIADIRLLLTPELSLCGYPPRDLLTQADFVARMQYQLNDLAAQMPPTIAVLVGLATVNDQAVASGEKPLHNSIALIDKGKVQRIFHKQLLPTYDVFDEDRYFEAGSISNWFHLYPAADQTQLHPAIPIKIGVTICEDLWNDDSFWGKRSYEVNPLEQLAEEEVDFIVNLSASPYTIAKQRLREGMLHHAAWRYQIPIIYANQVGGNDDLIFDGGSVAMNTQGKIVCRAPSFKSVLMALEFDKSLQNIGALKEQISCNFHQTITPEFDCDEAEVYQALVLGLRDYVWKCGFSKVVLGLSGGIDSALVAAIATDALGEANVLGILMPSPFSSEHSVSDAVALAENLEINHQTIKIQTGMEAFDQMLEPLFAGTEFGVAEENLQSRIRGNLLMAIANKFGYLLLSTGNKSEMSVGYCTLYGDMNGGLAVIADVPKLLVFKLCRWLNRDKEVIPENIITKPPSAELRPDQVDQDSLPPYEILDDILQRIIHKNQSTPDLIEAGHDPDVVAQVFRLLHRTEFKRRQAAPGLKITDRAFGTGWRMPIASRW
ncbi:NH(3)-dependent NAD(+) synthetase [[Leptolyngbya] sp. PCC 7376]|uniref:NAD+ synthase n=1 Tax=[Leptolyngbya] sp. PCC 7376 TaxID=111781 RepID=UPI00029F0B7E|nr:NAD+ synthase [[Leptolyngbya] sp. PCC 7376]AFY39284.1 NH(3)-dependent NAD(+) synthetase [[Leptolyngbya] sp. PCC 7376]